jgi:hypothetical protein
MRPLLSADASNTRSKPLSGQHFIEQAQHGRPGTSHRFEAGSIFEKRNMHRPPPLASFIPLGEAA